MVNSSPTTPSNITTRPLLSTPPPRSCCASGLPSGSTTSFPPAAGPEVGVYLRSRGITVPVPSVLRFGLCPHRLGGHFPAMVAPVVNVIGTLIGIHATYLRPDGSGKADFGHKGFQRECRGS